MKLFDKNTHRNTHSADDEARDAESDDTIAVRVTDARFEPDAIDDASDCCHMAADDTSDTTQGDSR